MSNYARKCGSLISSEIKTERANCGPRSKLSNEHEE